MFEIVERDVWYHHMKLEIEKENLKPPQQTLVSNNSRPSHVKPISSALNRSKASIGQDSKHKSGT